MTLQVDAWVNEFHLKNKLTNFVLAPDQFNLVLTDTPEVADNELVDAMKRKSKELLNVDMDEIIIDCLPITGRS